MITWLPALLRIVGRIINGIMNVNAIKECRLLCDFQMRKVCYSEIRPGFFGGMNDYDANGKKIGHSSPSFFGGMNHYDNNGHKVGESRPGFFGGLNHYDDKGHKRGHSNPGFLGGFNHYG